MLDQWLDLHHAVDLTTGPLAAVDLHWDLLANDRSPRADEELWGRAVATTLDSHAVLVLDRTDHLLHSLAHGEPDDLRWIAAAELARQRMRERA